MTTKKRQSVISTFFTKTPRSKTSSKRSNVFFEEENENVDDPIPEPVLAEEVTDRETQSDSEESETETTTSTSLNETAESETLTKDNDNNDTTGEVRVRLSLRPSQPKLHCYPLTKVGSRYGRVLTYLGLRCAILVRFSPQN